MPLYKFQQLSGAGDISDQRSSWCSSDDAAHVQAIQQATRRAHAARAKQERMDQARVEVRDTEGQLIATVWLATVDGL